MFKRILALFLVLFLVGCEDNKKPPEVVPELNLEKETLTLDIGEEYEIKYTTNIEGVTFTVEHPEILSITNNVVTALKVGNTTVTVKVGELSKKVTVVVETVINLNLESLEMLEGETYELKATSKAPLNYSTSNADVVSVSAEGVITAVGEGSAEVTVSLVDDEEVFKKVVLNVISLQEKAFNNAKENTEALTNYTLKVTIKEPVDETDFNESVAYYKFANDKFCFSNTNMSVFYQTVGEQTYEYKNTLEGYVKTKVAALPSGFVPFYLEFEYSILNYLNEAYFVKYGKEGVLDSFKNELGATQVSNIKITAGEYYEVISFNMTINKVVYSFTFEFIDINQTVVDLPAVE